MDASTSPWLVRDGLGALGACDVPDEYDSL